MNRNSAAETAHNKDFSICNFLISQHSVGTDLARRNDKVVTAKRLRCIVTASVKALSIDPVVKSVGLATNPPGRLPLLA